jgi:lipopolysaccharide export system protein LptC
MSAAPLSARQDSAAPSVLRAARSRPPINPRAARRRIMIGLAKRLLPLGSLTLLAVVALWPEFAREADRARLALWRGRVIPESGEVTQAAYHGFDERGRPYTMTATRARQLTPERINLTEPKGDITLESGNWMMLQSRQGVYLPRQSNLDLSQNVQLYRDDGTTIATDAATVDLKAGVAAGAVPVHAEGPFGTLDAQGFTLTDKGTAIQFQGPGRLVLNATEGQAGVKPAATESAKAP